VLSENLATSRAAIARAHKRAKHNPDDPVAAEDVCRARRDYYAATLEKHIRRVVAEAPDLTAEQRDRLAILLRGPVSP